MTKFLTLLAIVAACALPSLAGATTPGGTNYSNLKDNPPASAQCGTGAGSGAFGAFGTYSEFGIHDFAGGADGYQTGLNNAAVCGNRP